MEWLIFILIIAVLLVFLRRVSAYEIPKIIHQTAPKDESKWPSIWKPCQESWKKHFPGYKYILWSDEDLDDFIKTKYSWFYPLYSNFPDKMNRIDSARYFILYEYGGIYADMDYQCIKNFEHLLPKDKACAAESPHKGEKYQNALMVSPPKHPFWEHVFNDLKENFNKGLSVTEYAGPEVIHRTADSHPELFFAMTKEKFAQKHDDSFKHARDAGNKYEVSTIAPEGVYARHYGTASWGGVGDFQM